MKTRVSIRGALFAVAAMLVALCFAPSAFARVHVGVGISVPGISIGVGNCWRCGYYAPPVSYAPYYPPAYAAPVYYPAPVYYAPRPVYYGYGRVTTRRRTTTPRVAAITAPGITIVAGSMAMVATTTTAIAEPVVVAALRYSHVRCAKTLHA